MATEPRTETQSSQPRPVNTTERSFPHPAQGLSPQRRAELLERIPGWGADLELANRPGVPREALMAQPLGAHWEEPEPQDVTVRVFHTIERPGLTPVFGTTLPPRGVSGLVRALAYRFGEDKSRRWLALLLADRIDLVESTLAELLHGRPPLVRELGLGSEFRRPGEAVGFAATRQSGQVPDVKRLVLAGTLVVAATLGVVALTRGTPRRTWRRR